MSFSVNGITFQPQSAFDHATSQLNYINGLLQGLGLPTLTPSNGNALWWTLLGQGSEDANFDQIIMQATASLNVPMADDNQVINLLPIAGTQLIPASYSILPLLFTASSGVLNVPSGTQVPFGSYFFSTMSGITVPMSGSLSVLSICNTLGPITVPAGSINLTTLSPLVNLANVTNVYSAIPGTNLETPGQARARILQGKNIGVGIDGAITALRQLPGIGQAQVFWNPNPSGNLPLTGLPSGIPARTAWILVQNPVPNINITYLAYMDLPTSGTGFQPAYTQNYVTQAGQSFPVNFDVCQYQQIFATVYIDSTKVQQNGYASLLFNTLTNLNNQFPIGQRVSSEQLSVALAGFTQAGILGVTLSLSSGGPYGQFVQPNSFSIPFLASGGIYLVVS